jgi:hypothetical protein
MATILFNLNDTTPAAPSGKTNVKFQADSSTIRNVSAYIDTPVTFKHNGSAISPVEPSLNLVDGEITISITDSSGVATNLTFNLTSKQGNTGKVQMASGTATANRPLLYDSNGNAIAASVQGNTTKVQMASGTAGGAGEMLVYDANGNAVAGGAPPSTGVTLVQGHSGVTSLAFANASGGTPSVVVSEVHAGAAETISFDLNTDITLAGNVDAASASITGNIDAATVTATGKVSGSIVDAGMFELGGTSLHSGTIDLTTFTTIQVSSGVITNAF